MTIHKKILFTLLTAFSLSGCAGTHERYYILSMPSQPSKVYSSKMAVIGVEKITIPEYLYKREIIVAKNENHIILREDAIWGEDLDSGLTQRLVVFLQKKFNHTRVYPYPWGMVRQPNIKVSVKINRFIAQGNRVYLDASYDVLNLRTQKRRAELFHTSVEIKGDINSIVQGMDSAFTQLEKQVALVVYRFNG